MRPFERIKGALRPVSIEALVIARTQRSTLKHVHQENNEVGDNRTLSYLRAI